MIRDWLLHVHLVHSRSADNVLRMSVASPDRSSLSLYRIAKATAGVALAIRLSFGTALAMVRPSIRCCERASLAQCGAS